MRIKEGKTYINTQSGNEVRAIAPAAPVKGMPSWLVERTRGIFAGKQMVLPVRALAREADCCER